jgi:hypothetical protein
LKPPRRLTGVALDFVEQNTLYATHGLHAFAAKCPPPLAHWAIERYSAPGETVLDPMAGSGTALVEARLLGRAALGLDLDPIARLLARVKSTLLEGGALEDACTRLADEVATACAAWDQAHPTDEAAAAHAPYPPGLVGLERWFRPRVTAHLAILKERITAQQVDRETRAFFWAAMSSLIIARTSVANAWDLVHSRHHFRAHATPPDVPRLLRQRLHAMRRQMADLYARCAALPEDRRAAGIHVVAGDARALPLADKSVDLVFTSPPYCNALDYTRAHTFGVAWLDDVLGTDVPAYVQLGRRYVGTDRAAGSRPVGPLPVRAPIIQRVIRQVEAQDVKKGLVVRHYFHDMWRVLGEIARVLRPGRRAVLVVCPSHIRRIAIPTHEAFQELARAVPPVNGYRLVADGLVERKISERRRVMPYLRDRFGPRMETEYVVVLRKRAWGK